ncbi:MAG: zinc metallopeptidase [Saprospiraceae bacterium]|nr:zinc metallopeptidase [Saprospiraceae bacterium]
MTGYYILLGVFSLIGGWVSSKLKSKFNLYSKAPNSSRLSGYEVAHAMMKHYGVEGVKIVQGKGTLTDHYNPATRTVALSPAVFNGRSISSAAVAAHEVGHVIQHATAYKMLTMRSQLVPIVKFSATIQQIMIFGFIFAVGSGLVGEWVITILAITYGITALFAFITLPVEFDASKRALAWLDETGITSGAEYEGSKDALWWAALTYVSQALSALVMFLYFLSLTRQKR